MAIFNSYVRLPEGIYGFVLPTNSSGIMVAVAKRQVRQDHEDLKKDPAGLMRRTDSLGTGQTSFGWWFGTFFYFCIYIYIFWELGEQLTNIFQRGRYTTNQSSI